MFFQASNKCQLCAKHHDRCEGYSREEVSHPCPWRTNNKKERWKTQSQKSKGRMHKLCCVSGFPSVPRAYQALSKFRTFAHTIPLAWNVLPLTPYTAGPFLSSPHFLREALPNHPNQRGFILPSVTLIASVMFPSEHLECVLTLLVEEMLI